MKVYLNDLYLANGCEIKKRMKKGDRVEISFEKIKALGYSLMQDLNEWVGLPNVELVDLTDFVKSQLKEHLGIELHEHEFNQLSLF